jgi:hypothetical protein
MSNMKLYFKSYSQNFVLRNRQRLPPFQIAQIEAADRDRQSLIKKLGVKIKAINDKQTFTTPIGYHKNIADRLTSNKLFSEWIFKGLSTESKAEDPLSEQWIIIPSGLFIFT